MLDQAPGLRTGQTWFSGCTIGAAPGFFDSAPDDLPGESVATPYAQWNEPLPFAWSMSVPSDTASSGRGIPFQWPDIQSLLSENSIPSFAPIAAVVVGGVVIVGAVILWRRRR
jgi:hypothetical protein